MSLPAEPDIQHAVTAFNQGRFPECEALCRRLLEDQPGMPAPWQLLGLSLAEQNQPEAALTALGKACALSPADASIRLDTALVLAGLGRLEEAFLALTEAHRLAPAAAVVLTNMGSLRQSQGRWDDAMALYRQAIALDPDDAMAHGNLGGCLLGLGQWDEGFAEYEWRLRQPQIRRPPAQAPLWQSEPLSGKRLLVSAEQGYGDSLQFTRFLPALAKLGAAEITLECLPGLERLFAALPGIARIIPQGGPIPAVDFQIPLPSLGHRLGFPAATPVPYIKGGGGSKGGESMGRFRVGIVWTGKPVQGSAFQNRQHGLRHCPIELLTPLTSIPGVEWVSLQQAWASPQLEASGLPISDLAAQLSDFQATADIIAGLDLVISIDSAVAHLAGAMGKALWVLLGSGRSDYRWGRPDEAQSPWYPQAKLFRCGSDGWSGTIGRVAQTLRFDCALAYHRAGDTAAAQEIYGQMLAADPYHPQALCNLGQIVAQQGDAVAAEAAYDAALTARPAFPEAWNNLGALLQDQSRLPEAEAAFRQAVAHRPGFAAAWSNLGNALRLQNRQPEAVEAYRRAIALDPSHVQAHCGLGNALKLQLHFEEADAAYAQAIALKPDYAEALINRAGGLVMVGRLEEAVRATIAALTVRPNFPEAEDTIRLVLVELGVALLDRWMLEPAEQICRLAVSRYPDDCECHFRLGNVFLRQKRLKESEKEYLQVIAMDPKFAPAYNNLCSIHLDLDEGRKALERARQAVALDPSLPDIHNNLGNALRACGLPQDAMAAYAQAIALRPDFTEAFNNLGVLMGELGMIEGSLAAFGQAIALNPDYAEAYSNMGNVLKSRRRGDEAIAAYSQALAVRPDYHGARLNLAIALLQQGRWQEGWEEYRARWFTGALARQRVSFSQPEWNGEPLEGKTILLYGEQGYGDLLQFIRYAPLLAERGARVIVLAHKGLVRLFQSVQGIAEVLSFDERPESFDYHLAMMSAPRVFATTPQTIPAPVPYLAADPAEVEQWRQRLSHLPGRKVGLVWSGDPRPHDLAANMLDRQRSMDLQAFAFTKKIPGISLVNLQKGGPAAQLAGSDLELFDAMDEISDFAGTAALVSALDLVVSVDTSMVHLTGAIGKPVWILSRYDGCWRWLLDREDTDWYPSAKLFLQTAPNDWSAALVRLEDALRAFAEEE